MPPKIRSSHFGDHFRRTVYLNSANTIYYREILQIAFQFERNKLHFRDLKYVLFLVIQIATQIVTVELRHDELCFTHTWDELVLNYATFINI